MLCTHHQNAMHDLLSGLCSNIDFAGAGNLLDALDTLRSDALEAVRSLLERTAPGCHSLTIDAESAFDDEGFPFFSINNIAMQFRGGDSLTFSYDHNLLAMVVEAVENEYGISDEQDAVKWFADRLGCDDVAGWLGVLWTLSQMVAEDGPVDLINLDA